MCEATFSGYKIWRGKQNLLGTAPNAPPCLRAWLYGIADTDVGVRDVEYHQNTPDTSLKSNSNSCLSTEQTVVVE